jgi:hypothetical protein
MEVNNSYKPEPEQEQELKPSNSYDNKLFDIKQYYNIKLNYIKYP